MRVTISRHLVAESIIVLVIALAAFSFGIWYAIAQADAPVDPNPNYWLRYAFGVATGHGLTGPPATPAVDAFLSKKSPTLDLKDVPTEGKWDPIPPFSETHLYMIYATGWCWRVFGLSWHALAPIFGGLFCLSVLAVYGLFRLAVGRTLAVLGALCFAFTPGHLSMFPHERDYAKGPFILLVLFVLGLAIRRRTPWHVKEALALGAAAGAALGLGLGWRQDIQVCLLPATVIFALFLPGALRATWKARAGAIAAMFVVFVLLSWPILDAMRRGGNYPAHDIVNGYSEACTDSEGYSDPGAQLQPIFADHFTAQTIRAHARYQLHAEKPVEYLSKEYNAAGLKLVIRDVMVFPFNQLLRGVGVFRSVLMTAPLEFSQPGFPVTPLIQCLVDHSLRFWFLLTRIAPLLLLLTLGILAFYQTRVMLAASFLLLFFLFYPTLQYLPRHVFHLNFLPSWMLLLVSHVTMCFIRGWKSRSEFLSRQKCRQMAVGFGTVAAGLLLLFGLAFAVQRVHAGYFINGLRDIPRKPLRTLNAKDLSPGWTVLRPQELFPDTFTPEDNAWQFVRRFVAVEFSGFAATIPVQLHYVSPKFTGDYSYATQVAINPSESSPRTTFYFPAYSLPDTRVRGAFNPGRSYFDGIAVPDNYVPLVSGVYVLDHEPMLPLFARVDDTASPAGAAMARLDWYTPRAELRAALDSMSNKFTAGNMETWPPPGDAPLGFTPPKGSSSIAREEKFVSEGKSSVKQVWQAIDGSDRFGMTWNGAALGKSYDICIDAWNTGKSPVALYAVAPIVVPPSNGFRPYFTTITIQAPGLELSTAALPPVQAGQVVYWDNLRIAPVPRL